MTYAVNNNSSAELRNSSKGLSVFEKYLTLWVVLCIAGGIVLGKTAPALPGFLMGWQYMWAKPPLYQFR